MAHFVRGTKKIELGMHSVAKKSEWWEIKAKLSVSDRERVMDSLFEVRMSDDEASDRVYVIRGLGALRKVATVGWQLFDDEGEVIPFDRNLIDDLDPDDPITELVDDAIAGMNYDPFRVRGKARSARPSATTSESSSTGASKTAKKAST